MRAAARLALIGLLVTLFACADSGPSLEDQALTHARVWFQNAEDGARDDSLCHGLGLLKHAQFTCAQYLEHAARIDPSSREVVSITPHDSFGSTAGQYLEIYFTAYDRAGNEVEENLLLRRDEGQFRTYWYRTDSLLALLAPSGSTEDNEVEKDPLQRAYDEIIARYPSLYQYPPCYQTRPTSANLAGELMPIDAMDVSTIDAIAATCDEAFCFALIGEKIAPLCPGQP